MTLQQLSFQTDCTANTITIKWQGQRGQCINHIVKYRAKDSKNVFAVERTLETKIQMSNLQCETLYEIKVFEEDTNADESLSFKIEVRTLASVAFELQKSAAKICDDPVLYRLCHVNISNPPKGIQIREFLSDVNNKEERSLLLLGARGSGKSTLVDAFLNFITGVSLADNFRFKITDEIKDGEEDIVCYQIRCQDGCMIDFNLNIIDVPGFEARYNERIYQQLLALFQSFGYIGAACLVVPSFCRSTDEERCIFNNILSIFGNDITNLIPLITFYDGGEIKALTSLKDAKVPFKEDMQFMFNNSQLYSGKEHVEIWTRRQKTMQNLFGVSTVSVNRPVEKTIKVLETRIELEQSFEHIKSLKRLIKQQEHTLKEYEMKKCSISQYGGPSKNEISILKNVQTNTDQTDGDNEDNKETLQLEIRALMKAVKVMCENMTKQVECIKTTALLCDVPGEIGNV